MTYKFDSDILWFPVKFTDQNSGTLIAPAKSIRWKKNYKHYDIPNSEKLASKSKDIVWFPKDCELLKTHKTIVRELSNYFTLDIYGKCGNMK